MRIAFVDFMNQSYTVGTPRRAPLGGSQSAVCYLAECMRDHGWEVTFFNAVKALTMDEGIAARPVDQAIGEGLSSFDVAVVAGGCPPSFIRRFRATGGQKPFLVLWSGHPADQAAVVNLHNPDYAAAWDAVVLVSRWQLEQYLATFPLIPERCRILPNAVAPAFAALGRAGMPRLSARLDPPVLAYTSPPNRGLNILLASFGHIRTAIPDVRLKVFSGLNLYQIAEAADPFVDLYRQIAQTEGAEYVGALPQPDLAQALCDVTVLTYPATIGETYCIATQEALAAGCLVASSELGALPETLAGYGCLMKLPGDTATYARQFADMVVWLLRAARDKPESFDARQRQQVIHVLSTAVWHARAKEWIHWLDSARQQRQR